MFSRQLESIEQEFIHEGHEPMTMLARAIRAEPFATQLLYDTSMLRLWIRRSQGIEPELMVTYADGRMGGRPSDLTLNAYELTIFRGESSSGSTGDVGTTVAAIRQWCDEREAET
jgi:hypothetical protein